MTGLLRRCRMPTRLRAGLAVAFAYAFLLQGLLAPGASLPVHAAAGSAAMVLCDGDMSGDGLGSPGGPAGQGGSHDLCCVLGCMPGSAPLAPPAIAPASVVPAWAPRWQAAASIAPASDPTGPPRAWRPGSAGPRAPPSPIA
jgi:hypothetical protein